MRFPRQTAVNNLSSRVLGERAWLLYGGVMPVFTNPRRTPCFSVAPSLEDFEAIAAEAADWLAKNGFDELYGARPLARVIQDSIKKPLADDILFGRLTRGGHVKVELKDGKIAFDITPTKGAAVKEEEEETA